MIFFSLFILESILLFYFSQKLIKHLSLALLSLTKSHKVMINILAIIFLPGTIIHELSHLLTAGILLVPIGELTAFPEIEGESIKLGSVQIGKTDPLRLTIIGVAPVILGTLTILGILYFAQLEKSLSWWQIVLGLYLIFEIANTMFSSKRDIEGTIWFVMAILIVSIAAIVTLYFWRPLLVINIWTLIIQANLTPVTSFFKIGSLYLLVPLILDLLIILLTTPFTKHRYI